MNIDYFTMDSPSIGLWEKNRLRIAALVKELLIGAHVNEDQQDKMSYWQLIFLQSKANGCIYKGHDLPPRKWQWPRETWFQERLSHITDPAEATVETVRLNTPLAQLCAVAQT